MPPAFFVGEKDGRRTGEEAGGAGGGVRAERQALFLEGMRETCHFGRSVAAAGVSNVTVYNYRNRDPEFRKAYADALEEGVQRLHQKLIDEAIDRAGYEKSCTEIARGNTWLARRLRALDFGAGSGGVAERGRKRGAGPRRTRAELEQSLLAKLSLLNRRMGGKG